MNRTRKLLFAAAFVILTAGCCGASDIYNAQAAAGGKTGNDCADARALSSLASGDWVPGNTIHLCGTITTAAGAAGIVAQGSGTSSQPIIIKFEANAVLQAPYFGTTGSCYSLATCTAGIELYGYNYIIVDGGTNGIVQNTANGTDLANQQSSAGVVVYGNDIIVRNLTVRNIYLNDPNTTDTRGVSTADVAVVDGTTNLTLCNNSLNAARTGVSSMAVGSVAPAYPLPSCSSNTFLPGLNYFGNTLTDHCWMFQASGSVATTVNIFNNDMSGTSNWIEPGNYYHTDGIISWGIPQVTVYSFNNYFHDAFFGTAAIYCTYGGAGSGSKCYIFNNLFVEAAANANNGTSVWLNMTTGNNLGPYFVYNNTMINYAVPVMLYGDIGGATIENNLASEGTVSSNYFYSKGYGWSTLPSVLIASDYNSFYGGRGLSFVGGAYYGWPTGSWPGYSSWTTTGFDTHSVSGNPQINVDYTLASNSPDIRAGRNLSSLCSIPGLGPLCHDKNGAARPLAGGWDIGAFETPGPKPPVGLNGTVK